MKKLIIGIIFFGLMNVQAYAKEYFVEIAPVTSSYTERVEDGVTVFVRSDVPHKGDRMGFSGTSTCQVIDIGRIEADGYFTYQFKMLAGTTNVPMAGTTVSVHWRGSNVDSGAAWVNATKNTIIDGINAFSGITNVGYDMNDITGVTPFKFMRFEFDSGISEQLTGEGNIRPVGLLHIK